MADRQLVDIHAAEFIPRRAAIHNAVDNSATQTLANGVRTLYTNNKLAFEEGNEIIWNSGTSIIDAGLVLWSKQDIAIGGVLNAASANTRLKFELVIPDSGGEIPVRTREYEINRTGVDITDFITFPVYVGQSAIDFGFQIYMTAIGGSVDISNKSILNRR